MLRNLPKVIQLGGGSRTELERLPEGSIANRWVPLLSARVCRTGLSAFPFPDQ